MKIKLLLSTAFLFFLGESTTFSQQTIVFSDLSDNDLIGKSILLLEDDENTIEFQELINKNPIFKDNATDLIRLGLSSSTFWLKFKVKNNTSFPYLILVIDQPVLNFVELYRYNSVQQFLPINIGEHKKFSERKYQHPAHLFDLEIAPEESAIFYLKIKSDEPITLPISVTTPQSMVKFLSNKDMIMGIYLGIMLVMILYNLFIYITVRDSNYLYYIFYLGFICIAQASTQGYTFMYLWPETPLLSKYSIFIFAPVATIFAIIFINKFLQTAIYIKRTYYVLNCIIGLFFVSIIFSLNQQFQIAYNFINLLTLLGSIITLIGGFIVYRKGVHSAKYFVVAWSILLAGGLIYSLKEMGILPHNFFTMYAIQIGSALEAILLSFAF